jgi:hypothetical protein
MTQTILYSSPTPDLLEKSLNNWFVKNQDCKLISIQYQTFILKESAGQGINITKPFFTALIVYQTPKKSIIDFAEKPPMKINKPTDSNLVLKGGEKN